MGLRQHAEDVFGWSRFQAARGYDFNGTALVTRDGLVLLVDPVPATDNEHAAIRALGQRFEIVLLNADHERDAATFSQRYGAPVHVARADAGLLKLTGAVPFDDGQAFGGGWTARVLPALKTPGEAVLFNTERRLLVVGDAVIGDPLTGLRLVPPAKIPDRAAAMRSLAALCDLDFDGLLLGDGFVLPSGGRDALRKWVDAFATS
jgi:glyoxylase-like metal-dependent hydrolase (beta-lactamase superfamily II)